MPSNLELAMESLLRSMELTHDWWPKFEAEVRFHDKRRFRFDYACWEIMLAIECEGGIYTGGAHVRGKHFESDCEKYNLAIEMGWSVLRYSSKMIEENAIIQIERIVAEKCGMSHLIT